MTLVHLALAALLMIGPQPMEAVAAQLDLYNAKQAGLVGERPDGLVDSVMSPSSPEIEELVNVVNEGRMKSYLQIAQNRGLMLSEVQKLAGENLIEKTPPGQFIMTPEGQWLKKTEP